MARRPAAAHPARPVAAAGPVRGRRPGAGRPPRRRPAGRGGRHRALAAAAGGAAGTTGTPKCALNRHGGLVNRLRFMTRWFASAGDDVVLQNSKHTFDSSLWQLLWPLTTGGRTVLPVPGEFMNLQQTVDTIAAYQVTATDFVSSIFNILVALVDGDEEAQA